jgi:FkbM family methyltransferase
VYSVGVGCDVTWDLALIDRFGVRVDAFDPTPRSIRWVQSRQFPSAFVFHPLGLADFDGEAQFAIRKEHPNRISYNLVRSSIAAPGAFETVTAPVARLETIMDRLGHDRIDVLKMDIEGAEYEVLADIVLSGIRPRQLLVEFHYFANARQRMGQTERVIHRLNEEGYRTFARSPNGYEFSFVRV